MHIKYGKKIIWQDKDTWSLDAKLNPILHSALVKFKAVVTSKDTCAGCPGRFIDDHNSDESFEAGLAKWHEALDKMIYAFADIEPNMDDYSFKFGKVSFEKVPGEEGLAWQRMNMGETINPEEYDRYKADLRIHEEKRQEGLDLFAKHYTSLWW